jgi:hypothetical protein
MRKTKIKEGELFLIGFVALCPIPKFLVKPNGASYDTPLRSRAPGSALGSLPSVALSSVQVGLIVREANTRIEKVLASTAGKRVKTSVPRVVVNGRFWVAINGRF